MSSKEKKAPKKATKKQPKSPKSRKSADSRSVKDLDSIPSIPQLIGRVVSRQGQKDFDEHRHNSSSPFAHNSHSNGFNEMPKYLNLNRSFDKFNEKPKDSGFYVSANYNAHNGITYNGAQYTPIAEQYYQNSNTYHPQQPPAVEAIYQENVMLKNMMEFKNEIIWKVYSEAKSEQRYIRNELEKQAHQEFLQWSNLVDQYQLELSRYHLQCCYCGIKFDYQMINSNCAMNSAQAEENIKVKCEEQPPQEFHRTNRHFFSKPLA